MKAMDVPFTILEQTFNASMESLLSQQAPYVDLARGARRLYDAQSGEPHSEARQARRQAALGTPAIAFVLNTTLDTLEDPKVADEMPADAYRRALLAMQLAEHYVDITTHSGVLQRFYSQNEHLSDVAPNMLSVDENYFLAFSTAPFREVCCAAGGALRAARGWTKGNSRPEVWRDLELDTETDIVAHSAGLRIIASLGNMTANNCTDALGLPYASTSHFEPSVANDRPVVRFTPKTLRRIGALLSRDRGRGCPARQIIDSTSGTTFLDEAWVRITHTLMPPGARIQMPPKSRPSKGALDYF